MKIKITNEYAWDNVVTHRDIAVRIKKMLSDDPVFTFAVYRDETDFFDRTTELTVRAKIKENKNV
jgi:hypothetical protein